MSEGFVALLSGGLDSVVALAAAARAARPALALTFDYGQPAASREAEAAARVAAFYSCEHRVLELGWYRDLLPAAFAGGGEAVPEPETPGRESARAVWVPGRNLVMVAVAAAWAEKLGAAAVVSGFNAEEAATFPDNSRGFVEAACSALEFSSAGSVKLSAPLAGMDKREIVRLGRELGAPLEMAWSCYRGGESPCGRCESCRRRLAAEAPD
ncbi:MAG: 7-cyano-7-deazaguanine synthase QueC [Planctomycetota bacterium]